MTNKLLLTLILILLLAIGCGSPEELAHGNIHSDGC